MAVKEQVKLKPPIRVKATDLGWDGIALKLRAKGDEFEIPGNLFAEDWMDRLDGNEVPTEASDPLAESEPLVKRGRRPSKDVI